MGLIIASLQLLAPWCESLDKVSIGVDVPQVQIIKVDVESFGLLLQD